MPSFRTRIGNQGELLAASYLEAHGLPVLARNVRSRYGEIDLVVQDGDTTVFVEVRTRRSHAFGAPEESVTVSKRRRLALTAQQYLQDHGLDGTNWRVDVVSILLLPGAPVIQHYPGIAVEEPA